MSKYHNKITVVDGIRFDSQREAEYYIIYKNMEKSGKIANLKLQVQYLIIPGVYRDVEKKLKTKTKTITKCIQRPTYYYADFVYDDPVTGESHVIDVKGRCTKDYLLKKKLMLAYNNIQIEEVR